MEAIRRLNCFDLVRPIYEQIHMHSALTHTRARTPSPSGATKRAIKINANYNNDVDNGSARNDSFSRDLSRNWAIQRRPMTFSALKNEKRKAAVPFVAIRRIETKRKSIINGCTYQ